jgi:hypothetical protein
VVPRHGGEAAAGPATDHRARPGAAAPYRLRAVVNYGYADAFPLLRESGTFLREAAE